VEKRKSKDHVPLLTRFETWSPNPAFASKKKNIKERKEKQKQLVKITKMFPHNLSKLRQIDNLLELKSTDNSQIELDPMESRSVKKTIGARTEAHNMKITTFLRIIVSIFIVCSPETSHLSLLLGCAKSNWKRNPVAPFLFPLCPRPFPIFLFSEQACLEESDGTNKRGGKIYAK
jgi:hypothetical protein